MQKNRIPLVIPTGYRNICVVIHHRFTGSPHEAPAKIGDEMAEKALEYLEGAIV